MPPKLDLQIQTNIQDLAAVGLSQTQIFNHFQGNFSISTPFHPIGNPHTGYGLSTTTEQALPIPRVKIAARDITITGSTVTIANYNDAAPAEQALPIPSVVIGTVPQKIAARDITITGRTVTIAKDVAIVSDTVTIANYNGAVIMQTKS